MRDEPIKLAKWSRRNIDKLEVGDFIEQKCHSKDSKIVANRLRSAASMYRKRKGLNTSYKVTHVIGAVILERVK